MFEALEERTLMSVATGSLLVPTPLLSDNTYLLSQSGGIQAIQLSADEGVVEAQSLQTGSSLDLTSTLPNAFLSQQFTLQQVPTPQLLPNSMVAAVPLD
jgi:hypothetical protein